MPFKVNDIGINRNPISDFLLVLTYILSRTITIFQLTCSIGQTITFEKGVPLI